MISETKHGESFPTNQFLMDGYSVPFRFDRDGNRGGILQYMKEDIPSKLYQLTKTLRVFW